MIDEALKYNGQLPTNITPQAPRQLTNPKPAPVNSSPRSGAPNVTPASNTAPASVPVKP